MEATSPQSLLYSKSEVGSGICVESGTEAYHWQTAYIRFGSKFYTIFLMLHGVIKCFSSDEHKHEILAECCHGNDLYHIIRKWDFIKPMFALDHVDRSEIKVIVTRNI
jgi:hypothetical protein